MADRAWLQSGASGEDHNSAWPGGQGYPAGSRRFVAEVGRRDPKFPMELLLKASDHRLSSPGHVETLRRLVMRSS